MAGFLSCAHRSIAQNFGSRIVKIVELFNNHLNVCPSAARPAEGAEGDILRVGVEHMPAIFDDHDCAMSETFVFPTLGSAWISLSLPA